MSRALSRRWLLAGGPLLACALSGCTYTGFAQQAVAQEDALNAPSDLTRETDRSVDHMIDELHREHPQLAEDPPRTIVASVADIRDMNHSTPLGNIIANLVRARLTRLGVPVIDMGLRSSVKMSPSQGELVLSRNAHKVYPPPAAGMICTGTYAVARSSVFVSLKMIRATNAEIVAAADFRLPRTYDVRRLLVGSLTEGARASRG